ncbi:MAG: oxidoreductase [Sporichthyaceae bacterium]
MTGMGGHFAAIEALPGVGESVAGARAAVDRLAGNLALRTQPYEVIAETALRGARASAALEGALVDLAALRSGEAFTDPVAGPIARGAVRVSTEVGSLREVWTTAPRQALARLHSLAAADGPVEPEALGRLTSPGAAARLDLLAGAVIERGSASAVVIAAITHAEVMSAQAFSWGNGLVARAAARCVLIERGLDVHGVIAPEIGHLSLGTDAYGDGLDAYALGGPLGVGAWVCFFARSVELAAADALTVCTRVSRTKK